MRTVCHQEYDEHDLINEALKIDRVEPDGSPCNQGPYCPKCRLADATSNLVETLGLPFDYGDEMLVRLASKLPNTVLTKEQSDQALKSTANR